METIILVSFSSIELWWISTHPTNSFTHWSKISRSMVRISVWLLWSVLALCKGQIRPWDKDKPEIIEAEIKNGVNGFVQWVEHNCSSFLYWLFLFCLKRVSGDAVFSWIWINIMNTSGYDPNEYGGYSSPRLYYEKMLVLNAEGGNIKKVLEVRLY